MGNAEIGREIDRSVDARRAYVDRVLSFIDVSTLKPFKIIVNSGNGAVGLTFDAIAELLDVLGASLELICVHYKPDESFPNGIPKPLLPQNHAATGKVVKETGANNSQDITAVDSLRVAYYLSF